MQTSPASLIAASLTLCVAGGICHAQPAAAGSAEPIPLRVGIATTTVTPKGSVKLAGFAARKDPSTGVYKDLTASCMVLEGATTRLGLMAIDVIDIGESELEAIRGAAEKAGIARGQMMINCSHTHCGPRFRGDDENAKMFKQRTCGLLDAAVADLREARLDYTVGSCTMGISRRQKGPEGKIRFRPEPRKPIDVDVPVLRVISPEGKVRAVVFGYACHPTAMGGLEIGPDYPGFARDTIVEGIPGCLPIFLQGCGGDIKPRSVTAKGSFDYKSPDVLAELGHELGRAVMAALCVPPPELDTELDGVSRMVPLPSKKDPDKPYTIEIQVLRIGDLAIVGLTGEICVELGLRIKRELSQQKIWVNGYTNKGGGYLPPASYFPDGGYEVDRSRVSPAAEDILVENVLELVKSLKVGQAAALQK